MFVFKFEDGRFLKETGSDYILSKNNYLFCIKPCSFYSPEVDKQRIKEHKQAVEQTYFTSNINEAKLFKSQQAIRSSNCYSWGGTIHEVDVNIVLRK